MTEINEDKFSPLNPYFSKILRDELVSIADYVQELEGRIEKLEEGLNNTTKVTE